MGMAKSVTKSVTKSLDREIYFVGRVEFYF